ncbi:MAG TPA: hypothetical protein VFZ34_01440 [Blastocatellia bacterium]|nr:hypothetical protein [Blastocatellia bacterium]
MRRSGDTFSEQTFCGLLHRMIEDALRYLRSTTIEEFVVKHSDRAEAERFSITRLTPLKKPW